ncbi:MAG: methyltransferase type 11, partial [Anaerolineae bacterium]|nr:methyltransferase type 11 [Anaerolineae bacterium]
MVHGSKSIDHYWVNISELPYFRALLRAVEARFYEGIDLGRPILDLGCGDGQFVTTAFSEKIDIGLDPWTAPVLEASGRGGYLSVVQGSGYDLPF